MNKAIAKQKVTRALGILAIGAVLTTGGVFLWRNQFIVNFFSSASSETIQAVMVLGEKNGTATPKHATQVVSQLTAEQRTPPELIDRSESTSITSSLRDQAVLSYNDATKPITEHVYLLVRTGRNSLVKGISEKDPVTSVTAKVSREITALSDLLTARPGVFPKGYTIFIATLPDPTDGTGDVSRCNGSITNNGNDYIRGMYSGVNSAIKNTAEIYPATMYLVDFATLAKGHGISSSDSWFSDCLTLNETGEGELAKEFVRIINNSK